MFNRITIIGLGLIGGSLGINIHRQHIAEEVVGMDIDPNVLKTAMAEKIIDRGEKTIRKACEDSDCIILAVPPSHVLDVVRQVGTSVIKPTIVTDVTSVKRYVLNFLKDLNNPNVLFVGGHPIAGTEFGGISGAIEIARDDRNLFKERVCILTPEKTTDGNALNKVRRMWELLGSAVYLENPERHDEIVGLLSHLPHLLVYAILDCFIEKGIEVSDVKQFAGGGFKDTTRIGSSNPKMWVDILMTNRDQVLAACSCFEQQLQFIRKKLEDGDADSLLECFTNARELRKKC